MLEIKTPLSSQMFFERIGVWGKENFFSKKFSFPHNILYPYS